MDKKEIAKALMKALDRKIFDKIEELRANLDAHEYFKATDHILQTFELVEDLLDDVVDVWQGNLPEIYEEIKRRN